MGMRQRYLLGRYNFKKYSEDLGHDLLMSSDGIYVESTDVYRTIQSGYSEITGMLFEEKAQRPVITGKQ